MEITITRENNQYNKYMKWHLQAENANGGVRSEWCKTENEAERLKQRLLGNDNSKFTLNNRRE